MLEQLGQLLIFRNEEPAKDGCIFTLTFDTRKKTIKYWMNSKKKYIGGLPLMNITYNGDYEENGNQLDIIMTTKKDLFYGKEYMILREPIAFEMDITLDENILKVDRYMFDIQWGEVPRRYEPNFSDSHDLIYFSYKKIN